MVTQKGEKVAGPLRGLKILDFTTLLPGPYATMGLADMGADVLRIVSGSRPDLTALAPPFIPGTDISFATACLGRGKRCMTLNLKDRRAVEIIHRLLARYNILIEQFRPGVMEKLGLGYHALRDVNPALIYCSLTGYGQTGPYRGRVGHDINYLARSGLMAYSGRKEGGPTLTGMQIADVAAGSNNAVIGILAAFIARHETGRGQQVDVSMTDGVIAFNALAGNACLVEEENNPGRESFLLNGGSLYDFYETMGGGYISLGALEPQFFAAFCEGIGRPDLAAGGISPANVGEVKEEIRAIIRTKTRDEWTAIFEGTDACVESVLTLSEALGSDHARERSLVIEADLPTGGTVRQIAHPITFSETRQEYRSAGVHAGVHTKEVMRELGYADAEIDAWEEEGLFSS